MNRRSVMQRLLATGAVSLSLCLFAGNPPGSQPDYTIRTQVQLVLLDVSVKDSNGASVSGLGKTDFRVSENGRRQPITVFAHTDVPVTVGILVDESSSMWPKRADVILAAQTFIKESNPLDEVFVLNFNDKVTRGLPSRILFSDNLKQLSAALYRGVAQGKTALYDAVAAGLKQLELGRQDKKTLIVISDGGDNASYIKRPQVLDLVEKSVATIYTIGLFDEDDPDKDPAILKRLAKMSGGECYLPDAPARMTEVCRRIAKDIRARYTLGYVPAAADGPSVLRHIGVDVLAPQRGKLVAHTRKSYRL